MHNRKQLFPVFFHDNTTGYYYVQVTATSTNTRFYVFSQFELCFIFLHRIVSTTSVTCFAKLGVGLVHNYVIHSMRVRLGDIAKQLPPFFLDCVFHF